MYITMLNSLRVVMAELYKIYVTTDATICYNWFYFHKMKAYYKIILIACCLCSWNLKLFYFKCSCTIKNFARKRQKGLPQESPSFLTLRYSTVHHRKWNRCRLCDRFAATAHLAWYRTRDVLQPAQNDCTTRVERVEFFISVQHWILSTPKPPCPFSVGLLLSQTSSRSRCSRFMWQLFNTWFDLCSHIIISSPCTLQTTHFCSQMNYTHMQYI